MQTGKIVHTEAGKMSFSFRSVKRLSSGTKIIPPPAPSRPVTLPAQKPAINKPDTFRFK